MAQLEDHSEKEHDVCLVLLLDETGSMQSIKGDTVGGFNAYVETLQKGGADIVFSLVRFQQQQDDPTLCGRTHRHDQAAH